MQLSNGAVAGWVAALSREAEVLSLRQNGTLVGLLILAFGEDRKACHIGYLLAETAWGKGLATEALRGLIEALSRHGPMDVAGGVGRDNPASATVLLKLGFQRDPQQSSDETDMFVRRLG